MEFLAYVSLASLAFAGLYTVMLAKQGTAVEFQNRDTAQKIAEKVGFEAEMALVQGDGYSRVFSVPATVAGQTYNVTLVNGTSLVEWGDSTASKPTLYEKEEVNISTSDSNVFKVVNDNGEIKMVAR